MQIVIQFANEQKQTFFSTKNKVTIGRSKNSDIQIIHPGISRVHMSAELIDGAIYVTDLGSTNGILMNSVKLKVSEPTLYHEYFQISTGETFISISQEASPEEAPTLLNENRPNLFSGSNRELSAPAPTPSAMLASAISKKKYDKIIFPTVFIILAAAVTFYFNLDKDTDQTTEISSQQIPNAKKAVKAKVQFDETSLYYKYWDQGGCKTNDEKLLCAKLKNEWKEKEFLINAENIYIFINLTREAQTLNIIPDQTWVMSALMLAYYSSHPSIRATGKKCFTIGFIETTDTTPNLKLIVSLDYALLPELSNDQHKSIFSRAFIGENHWYNKLIQPALAQKGLE